MNTKVNIGLLVIFCVLIVLPPIIHGYVYPSIGDDTAEHLNKMTIMANEGYNPFGDVYTGYMIVAYPMIWLHNWLGWSLDTQYMWFSYLALIGVGLSVYFTLSRLVNRTTGLVGAVMVVFVSQGVMFQFYYGVLFNMINIGLILPLIIYFAVKYITEKKYLIPLFVSIALYSLFHTSAIYMPAFIGIPLAVYAGYKFIKREKLEMRLLIAGFISVLISVGCLVFFIPDLFVIAESYSEAVIKSLSVPLPAYLYVIISIPVLIGLLVFIPYLIGKILKLDNSKVKALIYILISIIICLGILVIFHLSNDPFRQALDVATILAMLGAILLVMFVKEVKRKAITIAVVILFGAGIVFNLVTWFGYNSAITKADMQAIEYVNGLDYTHYNCSTTIASWVYQRFIELDYIDERQEPLIIVRNEPMTPRSTQDNFWYLPPKNIYNPDGSYTMTKMFTDGDVTVKVYER